MISFQLILVPVISTIILLWARQEILYSPNLFNDIDGNDLNLNKFKNKVIVVVNVASQCGFTKQYEDMQKVWDKYQGKGIIMLGVPSNDFGNQEPGNSKDIKNFCEAKFGITFPMTEKVSVKGESAHPFYKWAKMNHGNSAAPKWNFHKIIIPNY